jgi:glycosyltransferase involved in cell wall biosynthesis
LEIGLVVPGFCAAADDWCIPALRQLVGQLCMGDQVRVLAVRYPYRAGRYSLFNADVTAIGGGTGQGRHSLGIWRRLLTAVAAEHRRRRFDVLHAFWANETGLLTAVAGRALGIPTIVSLAGGELVGLRDIGYGGQLARSERWKVHMALRLARAVTAGSHYLMTLAAPKLPSGQREKLRLVPLGVDLDLFRPAVPPDVVTGARLVQVASLVPVKDQQMLLRAMALLKSMEVPVRLEIAGEGPRGSELRALANELGLSETVLFLGELPHPRLPRFYRGARLFLQTSQHEAQGMAVLEAAACGVPVVGTEVGVLPELSPRAALAVPVGDHLALAEAIAGLLKDPSRTSGMGTSARQSVETRFGLSETVRTFRNIYHEFAS